MTGAVVNCTSELTVSDISPSDSVDGSVSTSVLSTDLRKLESLQAALNNIQGLGRNVTPGQATPGMISTQSSLLTAPRVQTVSNETVPGPYNVMAQSNTLVVHNNRNGSDNVLKRPISASATAPIVNKVIITNDPSTSQPQVIPVGQISRPSGSLSHISPGVSLIPQSQSPRTPTKTITISQQGVLSPSRVRMAQVMGSPTRVPISTPTRVPISRLASSPAKTPTKITMIPVTVGRSPLKIAPAAPAIPVINNSATNSTGPLHTTITMSPSKIVKEGGMVHIIQKPIQPSSNATIVIPPPKTVSAQPVVNKVTIPTNVQQIHVPGNKFHYIRLAAPPSSGGIAKPQVITRPAAPPMITMAPGQPQPQLKVAIPPTPTPQHQIRPSSVQRLILPAGSGQVPIRPVLSSGPVPAGAQIIRTTVPAVSGNLGQLGPGGTTFITAGASGQGVQGFALVPASYLSQIQQQQIQVKPAVSAPAQTSLTTSRADFVPIASSNPVVSASSQSKSNATGSSSSTSAVDASGARPRKPCNCTKSQCLKLYCDCFANGEFCHNCNCNNCANNLEHEEERSRAIKTCLERNPHAFHPKIGKGREGERDRRHNKGCNCKRSGCLKNYCECYEAKIMCSSHCKCYGCKNFEESPERKTLMHLADAAEVRVLQQTAAKTKLSSQISDLPSRQTHSAITGERLPFSFVTAEVAEATCACLLAQAEEADRLRMPHVVQERMVIEEFGRCLLQIIESASKTKAKDPDET